MVTNYPMFWPNGNNAWPDSSFDREIVGCTVVVCEQYSMWT